MKFIATAFVACLLLVFSATAQVNLNLGLAAYYPFSGNANDQSGNNNNPNFNNATPAADRFGNPNSAYAFNGIDNRIRIPNSPTLNFGNAMSVCAWVRVDGFYQGVCHGNNILGKGDVDYGPGNYQLRFDDNGYVNYQNCVIPTPDITHQNFYGINAGMPQGGYAPFIQPGTWYSIVYTCDGTTVKFYVNCELKLSKPADPGTFTNADDLFLGCFNDPAVFPYWFNGVMDEIRIYNRALNENEVRTYGNCPLSIGNVINNYTPVLSLGLCKNSVTVEDGSAFGVGDTVLMIQMKGAVVDSSNTAAFGTITDYKNSGNYEFNYVKSKTGNVIELLNNITRPYDIPNGKVQLIRVPWYQDVTVTANLTCLPWDGSKGGVLVFNVANTLTLNANLDVSGKGFVGGIDPYSNPSQFLCNENQFYYPQNPDLASGKGEAIALISNAKSFGKGALANGGGGGNSHNSGGGGGANGNVGGFGGYNFEGVECPNSPFDNRGIGGHALAYNNAANKIFLAGAGGAGHSNNPEQFQATGGNGAGIIIVTANNITSSANKIIANGNPGKPCALSGTGCHEGMGGGGAGGTVLLDINNYLDNTNIEVIGGKGADMIDAVNPRVGPGGGGSGGLLWFSNAALPGNVTVANNGGANGVCSGQANAAFGATPGQAGINVFDLQIPVDNVLFTPAIDSVRFRDSATGCLSFDFKGVSHPVITAITNWQWYFGDNTTANTQDASHTYATAGTYTVKLVVTAANGCKDSLIRNVTTLTPPVFDFGFKTDACNPLNVQFDAVGTSTQNPYWEFGDGGTNTGNLHPSHTYLAEGNYIVKFAVGSGVCVDTITKTISLGIIREDIINTTDTTICAGTTKQLLTKPSLSFCWTPTTYLDNPNSPNPIISTPQTITYFFTAQTTGNNLIVNGSFGFGNTGFTSEYNFAFPNTTEGEYYVGTSPQAWNASLSNCSDHTTGSGNMMLINGSPAANIEVWQQTVAVTPNTNYAFSTWIQALWPPNPAQLQFSINGKDIGNMITASLPTCTWTQFFTTWNSGNSTSATISIVNKNTLVQGNDFALDDISFAPVFIKRDSVTIRVDTPFVRTSNDTTICLEGSAQLNTTGASTYSWTPPTGLDNPAIGNPVADPSVPGSTTQYIVSGTNANGCIAKDTVNVTVRMPPMLTTIAADTTICANTSIQLFAIGGISYSWTPAETLDDSTSATPIATPTTSTTYTVTITDIHTCINSAPIQVTLKPLPVFTVNAPVSECDNKPVQLLASGGNVYAWTPGNMNSPNPTVNPATSTNYTVQITETTCNVSTTLTTSVTRLPNPDVQVSKLNDLDCNQDFSQLTASGAASYSWSPAASLDNPNSQTPRATPVTNTLYTVTGKDANGCINTDTVTVYVTKVGESGYLMPNGFTPNNDGLNDCFGIKYWGVIEKLDFAIYNRWGERIWYTTRPGDCWDGTYKGVLQNPDVYVYLITAKTFCGEVFRKGTFVLIR